MKSSSKAAIFRPDAWDDLTRAGPTELEFKEQVRRWQRRFRTCPDSKNWTTVTDGFCFYLSPEVLTLMGEFLDLYGKYYRPTIDNLMDENLVVEKSDAVAQTLRSILSSASHDKLSTVASDLLADFLYFSRYEMSLQVELLYPPSFAVPTCKMHEWTLLPALVHQWPKQSISVASLRNLWDRQSTQTAHGPSDDAYRIGYVIINGTLYRNSRNIPIPMDNIGSSSIKPTDHPEIRFRNFPFEDMLLAALVFESEVQQNTFPIPLVLDSGDVAPHKWGGCKYSNGEPWSVMEIVHLPWKCVGFLYPNYHNWKIMEENPWRQRAKQLSHYINTKKANKAVWRGSTTYPARPIPSGWRDIPRVQLVSLGFDRSDILDAKITNAIQIAAPYKEEMIKAGYMASQMHPSRFSQYRAVIDIDGNSWSSRFASLLCSDAVVLKIESRWKEHFSDLIVPWIHYVPVSNLSNVVEQIEFVLNPHNHLIVDEIVRNANEFCVDRMSRVSMAEDALSSLTRYAKLMSEEKEELQSWFENEATMAILTKVEQHE